MSEEAVVAHLRRFHGLEDGECYDPYWHQEIPAMCFGSLVPEGSMLGPGQHLRPYLDVAGQVELESI